jgi:hypothetical protein
MPPQAAQIVSDRSCFESSTEQRLEALAQIRVGESSGEQAKEDEGVEERLDALVLET